jgi:hypothetical protein
MPTFCRHNRLIQNCPICSREQSIELRPVISSSAPRSSQPRPSAPRARSRTAVGGGRTRGASARPAGASAGGLRVRRLERGADDGYQSPLVPGLKSSVEAERLADELAFAAARLATLAADPPGLYAEVADPGGDLEERTWLAFLIAYIGPLDSADPFAEIERVRTGWTDAELPSLDELAGGPRGAHEPGRGTRTLEAYRTWARRAGSQAAAFSGEAVWTPERRFARTFERLALPGLHRDARFELLVSLGALGLYDLSPAALLLGGENPVTLAAKRALGIGDPLLLERRAAELARATRVALAALDLGLHNWESVQRTDAGVEPNPEAQARALSVARDALGL